MAESSEKNEHVKLSWSAASRPFRQRSQEYFKTIAAMVFLIAIILFFAKEFLLIGAMFSVAFVGYALASVPPSDVENKITNLGIETAGHFHRWEEFRDFWFEQSHGQQMLVIHTFLSFPGRLYLLVGGASEEKIKALLSEHIPYREKPEKSFLDKASAWLVTKIPLEKTS